MILSWPRRPTSWSKALVIALFPLSSWGKATLLPDEKNNVEVYSRCSSAVVNITTVTLKQDFFFQVVPERGVGSGAIFRPDGFIVTNDHVLGSAQKISVTLFDKSEHAARIVGRDPDTDLAVLKIDPKNRKLPTLTFADPDDVAVGQKVLAIGNPFGLGGSLTTGIVSSLGRDIQAETGRTIKDVIQTDAAINPGNSGGPLFNSAGELLGINAQIFSTSGGSVGVGFAISVKTVSRVVEQLIQFGQVQRPWLGFAGVAFPPELLQAVRVPVEHGVMVTNVYRNGPASRAGLRAADKEFVLGMRIIPVGGDVIFQIDNRKVITLADLQDYIFEKKKGERVTLHFMRNGKPQTTTVTLSYPESNRRQSL